MCSKNQTFTFTTAGGWINALSFSPPKRFQCAFRFAPHKRGRGRAPCKARPIQLTQTQPIKGELSGVTLSADYRALRHTLFSYSLHVVFNSDVSRNKFRVRFQAPESALKVRTRGALRIVVPIPGPQQRSLTTYPGTGAQLRPLALTSLKPFIS